MLALYRRISAIRRSEPECCSYRARREAGGASGSNTERHASREVIERFVRNISDRENKFDGAVADDPGRPIPPETDENAGTAPYPFPVFSTTTDEASGE
jgi:hypothetical protein